MPKEMDRDFIKTILEDFQYLRRDWGENVDDATLRRGSTILRRLLVNNDLQKAWKLLGFKKSPLVESISLARALKRIPIQKVKCAAAGGATYKGTKVAGIFMAEGAYPSSGRTDKNQPPTEILGIHSFMDSICLVVNGQTIERRLLIKYVANKLGGAHYDRERASTEEGRIFSLLDEASEHIKILDKDVIYFELLSIGQAFVSSKDIDALCEKARQFLAAQH